MNPLLYTALLVLTAFSTVVAQEEHPVTAVHVLNGIDGYSTAGNLIILPEDSTPTVTAAGRIVLKPGVPAFTVRASNLQRHQVDAIRLPVDASLPGEHPILLVGSGKVWVDVTTVDFDNKSVGQYSFTVVIGDNPSPPGPTPDIDPKPEPEPDKATSPFPEKGLRVLIVYEIGEIPTYDAAITKQLFSKSIRAWGATHCVKGPSGVAEMRILDKDTKGEQKTWTDALARPRTSNTWILIGDGEVGFEGPLPDTEEETLKLLEGFVK